MAKLQELVASPSPSSSLTSLSLTSSDFGGMELSSAFQSAKLVTTLQKHDKLAAATAAKIQNRESHINSHLEEKDNIGMPQAIVQHDIIRVNEAALLPNVNYAYGGFTAINLIENKESISYLAGKVSTTAANVIDAIPQPVWGGLYFLSSTALAYGSGAANIVKSAAINTGVFEVRKFASWFFSSEQDLVPTPQAEQGMLGFMGQYTDNIVFDVVSTLVQTAVIAGISGATLGVGGILLPVAMTVANDYIKYYNIYHAEDEDATSISTAIMPTIAAVATTAMYLSQAKAPATDLGLLSSGLNTIQKGLAALPVVATVLQAGEMTLENIYSHLPNYSDSTVSEVVMVGNGTHDEL
jgi:hypothetical protein